MEIKEFYKWLEIAANETPEVWEAWVARPCVESALAPRQARAMLEVAGHFANCGIGVERLIREIMRSPQLKKMMGFNSDTSEKERGK